MPRLARDLSLPTDRADRRRELARQRQARKRERDGTDHVAALARQLCERLTEAERRRLAELLVPDRSDSGKSVPAERNTARGSAHDHYQRWMTAQLAAPRPQENEDR